jgi:hypothetical protein
VLETQLKHTALAANEITVTAFTAKAARHSIGEMARLYSQHVGSAAHAEMQQSTALQEVELGETHTWNGEDGELLTFKVPPFGGTAQVLLVFEAYWDNADTQIGSEDDELIGVAKVKITQALQEHPEFEFRKSYDIIDQDFGINQFFVKLDAEATRVREMANRVPGMMQCLKFAIHPHSMRKLCWDSWILILVFYSAFYTPYQAAYLEPTRDMAGRDVVVDLCFWLDMILNFFTGYDKGFEVIMKKAPIVKNYLKRWFLFDFVSTMNWGTLWMLSQEPGAP